MSLISCGTHTIQAQWPLADSFNPGANAAVYSLAVQADGKILVGGDFTTLAGQTRENLARFNPDGTLDLAFNPGADGGVYSLTPQPDGRILVGGIFTTLGGHPRGRIARLNADGTVDPSFNPSWDSGISTLAAVAQTNGQILVGGIFTVLGGQTRNSIARFNSDGSLDLDFNPDADSTVSSLALQPDGKILVGGDFTTMGGQPRRAIARLNSDGTLDPDFDPNPDGTIYALAIQADGKVLIGGTFTTVAGQLHERIARINTDGTPDSSFNPGADDGVQTLAVQADGKILVGGTFATIAGQARERIARLNADGSLDPDFNPCASGSVTALTLQSDGKVLVGGDFAIVGGEWRNNLARLHNTGPATDALGYNEGTITWLRGGTGPEVIRSTFEYSADRVFWTMLGDGARRAGGWQHTGGRVKFGAIRGRGYSSGGFQNGSGGIVESIISAPFIEVQPSSMTSKGGATAPFSVGIVGSAPLTFQWRKAGVNLTDGVSLTGATTATLRLDSIWGPDSGDYAVVVTNAFGSVTSVVASLTVVEPVIDIQPTHQIGQFGGSAAFSVSATGTGMLSYQWRKDRVELPGATGASLTVTNVQAVDVGNYDVVVCGGYGCVTSAVAALEINLVFPDPSFNPGADGGVYSLTMQHDGRILVGGDFGMLEGQPRNYVARLNADGTLEPTFNPIADTSVYSLVLEADDRVLVGGWFTMLGDQPRDRIARVNADGALDPGFDPRANSYVYSLAVQADGDILAGGDFTWMAGQTRNSLARLKPNGTLDISFNPDADGGVSAVALQPDGKVLVGGWFTVLSGQTRERIARLHSDGTLDLSFNPGADAEIHSLAVQADGRILVGGNFTMLGGHPRNRLARLNADGTLDSSFEPDADDAVYSLSVQADGKILVGGDFAAMSGQSRERLARLNPDGTVDPSFNPGADSRVLLLAAQADGKILVGGLFTTLGGQPRSYVARLDNTGPAADTLIYDGATITWRRSGTGPEVWRTSFEYSTDGAGWALLGEGVRIPGGWQLGGMNAKLGAIRARGYAAGGYRNAAGGIVESVISAPIIVAQPENHTNSAGTTATLSVGVIGSIPLSYSWRKAGVSLTNSFGHLTGVATATLSLNETLGSDGGGYDVVVSNRYGSVTSLVATLVVVDPAISIQPVSQLGQMGSNIAFSVAAGGTGLSYQWRKDALALAGATSNSLMVDSLSSADGGAYDVVVCGGYGCVTSAVAKLSVNVISVDASFNPRASGMVYALAVQPDRKILVGGSFTTLAGQTNNAIARLNSDGTADSAFHSTPPTSDTYVSSLALQADRKILVGGYFAALGGEPRTNLGRLNGDGTLDRDFDPGMTGEVISMAVQTDGKILVGGHFSMVAGQPRTNIARLNPDGSLDAGFNPGADGTVNALAVQADGRILAGGAFGMMGGQSRHCLARLNDDGSLDGEFHPTAGGGGIYGATVSTLLVQSDGKVLVGGYFISMDDEPRGGIARLNADGTLEAGFNPNIGGTGLYSPAVFSLAAQSNGKIVIGGFFSTVAGEPHANIARINADGTVDDGFCPETPGWMSVVAAEADGNLLVSDQFDTVGFQPRSRIVRLRDPVSATQRLSLAGSKITWLRGGSGPEVWCTSFEICTNGSDWLALGAGARVPGGWQFANFSSPPSGTIRARGHLTGGYQNASSSFVETLMILGAQPNPDIVLTDGQFGINPNGFGLTITGSSSASVVLEVSTNLVQWSSLDTNFFGSGTFYYTDSNLTNIPLRFYRVRLWP